MEITIFDGRGHPVAYIADDDENSIYLWSGHAVAYIVSENVYGWNGHHLGWFIDGVVYDIHGRKVGSIQEKCPYATYKTGDGSLFDMKYLKSKRTGWKLIKAVVQIDRVHGQ